MTPPKYGTLYGIGVGPGDPELIALKAVRRLGRVDMVFAASSSKNGHSRAVEIARSHLPAGTTVQLLSFPMTLQREPVRQAWQAHARTIIAVLAAGRDAAFLTLGDPMTYSTFGYILRQMQRLAPLAPIETIPGITSYQAAAARLNLPLVEGDEALLVLSGVHGGGRLRGLAAKAENIVFLKAYKNTADIVAALEECELAAGSTAISHCGLAGEEIMRDIQSLKQRPPGYWTLIIAKRNGHDQE